MWNPEFWDYFVTYVADDMKEGMAPEIKRIIGLNDDFYYDDALECQSFRYKQKIEEAKKEKEPGVKTSECSWVEAIKIYKTMPQEARNNVKRLFHLAPEFLQNAVISNGRRRLLRNAESIFPSLIHL